MRKMRNILTGWSIAFVGYMLAAGRVSINEVATGAVLAVAATTFAGTLARVSAQRFAWPDGSLRPILRAFANLPYATALTSVALWHAAVTGRSRANAAAVPFDYGAPRDPAVRTRRALALLLATLAPDRFVVRMEPGDGRTLLHAIVPAERPTDRRWLT